MNKIYVTGYLGNDPETKEANGTSYTTFNLASHTRQRDRETDQPITNWYRCTAWRGTGETIAKYFHKGSRIAVMGDLLIRQYKDNNGADRMSIQITVGDFEFLDSASQNNQNNQNGQHQGAPAQRTYQPRQNAAPAQGYQQQNPYNAPQNVPPQNVPPQNVPPLNVPQYPAPQNHYQTVPENDDLPF